MSEVTPEQVKEFFADTTEEAEKAPEPVAFDDWTQTIENQQDFKISTKNMARLAYTAVMQLDVSLLGTNSKMVPYSDLSEEMVKHVESKVNYFVSKAANPNGYEECAALHDLVLSAKLHEGWRYAAELSEENKQDPLVMPYRSLPIHLRTYDYLFRSIVIALLQIWRGC
jgi:hypothetical protein